MHIYWSHSSPQMISESKFNEDKLKEAQKKKLRVIQCLRQNTIVLTLCKSSSLNLFLILSDKQSNDEPLVQIKPRDMPANPDKHLLHGKISTQKF
ncbi:CLUMA_CG010108, isoform A [Clunio marinus]|uniref:CLUMA_CG010108, isoform A n=1 Tax=Clunio marinus TaxID=568069 RepID=A0A1J1I897_9DIPT|nr:CLUMA_CG010108, isoform A [Clunio marinus]